MDHVTTPAVRPISIRFSTRFLQARVANFKLCENDDCKWAKDDDAEPHLAVETKIVEMHQGRAQAVSYAWGEFGRQKRTLGHFRDGRTPEMELGEEWVMHELRDTLHMLCTKQQDTPAWLWIDQICIDQDDPEAIRSTLNCIPDIFRIFENIVLLPESPCECLQVYADRVAAGIPNIIQQWSVNPCYSILNASGWATRLWTRQELMYAGRMRVVWTVPTSAKCLRLRDLRNLSEIVSGGALHESSRSISESIRLWIALCQSKSAIDKMDINHQEFRGYSGSTQDLLVFFARRAVNNLTSSLMDWAEIHNKSTIANPTGRNKLDLMHIYLTNFLSDEPCASDYWHALPNPTFFGILLSAG